MEITLGEILMFLEYGDLGVLVVVAFLLHKIDKAITTHNAKVDTLIEILMKNAEVEG